MENNNDKKNPFYERLKKYMNKEVTLELKSGKKLEGKLVAINFLTMNFIVEGKTADYVIRDDVAYMSIQR